MRKRVWGTRNRFAFHALPAAALLALVGVACAESGGAEPSAASARTAAGAKAAVKRNIDLTRLRVGDGRVTTAGARRNYVYSCQSSFGMPGASGDSPWINGSTYNFKAKPRVDGNVDWPSASFKALVRGSIVRLAGNGLPKHTTGTYPISSSDDAYTYDRNPNSINAVSVSYRLPAKPKRTGATCTSLGPIGVTKSGAAIFNALDGGGNDAVAHEIQDRCSGHPERVGQYHYHSLPECFATGSKKKHSTRIGWALDGFPIYGPRGNRGAYMTNAMLDKCHGHTHKIKYLGKRRKMFHYHATMQYPYTLGCYRGTPVSA